MKKYNKLVRDKIPEIIGQSGASFAITELDDELYQSELDFKLNEEFDEYWESGSLEELADMVEVIYAIVRAKGYTIDDFENVRAEKLKKSGAFEKRIYLKWVEDKR